ncbi:MAG: hypothetical protein LBK82_10985, partial [Planctomycetaceae bacterium]|nr:hypothetical protein [Planctomycetaceae bacterium]
PQQERQVVTKQYRDSNGNFVTETMSLPKTVPVNDKDELYTHLAIHYWNEGTNLGLEGFSRTFVKLTPAAQKRFAEKLLKELPVKWTPERLLVFEKMVDQMPSVPVVATYPVTEIIPSPVVTQQVTTRDGKTIFESLKMPSVVTQQVTIPNNDSAELPNPHYMQQRVEYIPQGIKPDKVDAKPTNQSDPFHQPSKPPQFTTQRGEDAEVTVTGKVIEDCDRPWAMTSDSLYGMFPADWNKEAQKIPPFIVELGSDELAKKLAASVSGDGQDFTAACQSILALENKPMSSPWFETGGGRLRSDIRYTLSAKGQMFVRLLKTVKDSTGNAEKTNRAKLSQKTLEKIELILE